EHTRVATVLTDMNNRFLRANAAFAEMFGYSLEEILKLSMADVTHPDHLAESYARRKTLLDGRSHSFQMEKRYVHRDGSTLWGLTNVALVRDPGGRPQHYVGQVQNITERKRAEQRLAVQHAVVSILAQASDLRDAAPGILRTVGENIGW